MTAPQTTVEQERRKKQRERTAKWEQDLHRPLVKVLLSASRPEVTRDHAWGLTADIQNVSQEPIRLNASEIFLVMQPEARTDESEEGLASYLPSNAVANAAENFIVLQPGDHYLFFWDGKEHAAQIGRWYARGWQQVGETMDFLPGPYTFHVLGRVHLENEGKLPAIEPATDAYRTFSESITIKLGIGQFGLWLCAGLGATLAYALVALHERGDVARLRQARTHGEKGRAVGKLVINALSAFLLGAVLSVVANRLSDTQFPVKVSVNDVWGALTVGFVFYFIGGKFIDKLRGLVVDDTPEAPGERKRHGVSGAIAAHGV